MTTSKEIIAAAKAAGCELRDTKDGLIAYLGNSRMSDVIEHLYAIALEEGRRTEREECAQILERQDVDPSFKYRMANAIRNGAKRMTALELYNANMEGEIEPDPIERLRFFLSLALTGQDWLDVEQFIDDITNEINQLKEK